MAVDYQKLYQDLYNDVADMMGDTYNKMKALQEKSNLAHMQMQRENKQERQSKAKKPAKKSEIAK